MAQQTIDYDALAKKYGGSVDTVAGPSPSAAPANKPPQSSTVDYDALAAKYGGEVQGEAPAPHPASPAPPAPVHPSAPGSYQPSPTLPAQDLSGSGANLPFGPEYYTQLAEKNGGTETIPPGHLAEILKPVPMSGAKPQATMQAWQPSLFERGKIAFRKSQIGNTLANSWADIERMSSQAWDRLNTPMVANDQQDFEELQKKQSDFIDRYIPETIGGSKIAGGLARGGAKGVATFAEEMTSPVQIGLMLGTFGESALARAAVSMGMPKLVPAARTLGKLIQAEFITEMAHGAYVNLKDAGHSVMNGNWEQAAQQGVQGLASLLMARGSVTHAEAVETVQRDLNNKAVEMAGTKFDNLTPEQQGGVIDATVKSSPQYQAMLDEVDAANVKEAAKIKAQRARDVAHYEGLAFDQAYNPDAVQRSMNLIRRQREILDDFRVNDQIAGIEQEAQEKARVARNETLQQHADSIADWVKQRADEMRNEPSERMEQGERNLQEEQMFAQRKQELRAERRAQAAEERLPAVQTTSQIASGRTETAAQRRSLSELPTEQESWRPVDSEVDQSGHVTYPATYIDQPAKIGVATDGELHSVYRMSGDRIEWLDRSGIFVSEPTDLYQTPSADAADTLARISAVSTNADTLAEVEGARPEHIEDSNNLDEIRKALVAGEISPDQAQKQAGIAQVPEIKDEYRAAREGQLAGPFADDSPSQFSDRFENDLRESGASEEEVKATMEALPAITRAQTEGNLHHVQQSGDYILSKKGVRWTLDAKGMLHPDNGGPVVPLLKRGKYSSQAMRLAASGKIGYGSDTYENVIDRQNWSKLAGEALDSANLDLDTVPSLDLRPSEEREARRTAYEAKQQRKGLQPPPGREESLRELRRPYSGASQDPLFANLLVALENLQHGDVTRYMKDPDRTIQAFVKAAENAGVSVESLVRLRIIGSGDALKSSIAALEPGDKVVPRNNPNGAWTVVSRAGDMFLQYGDITMPLDRINPSEMVQRIMRQGDVQALQLQQSTAKSDVPLYIEKRKEIADEVKARQDGTVTDPIPETKEQAKELIQDAEIREGSVTDDASTIQDELLNPTPLTTVEQIEEKAAELEDAKATAEAARRQTAEAKGVAAGNGKYPQKASISARGITGKEWAVGSPITVIANGERLPAHYELVDPKALTISFDWNGNHLERNPRYPEYMQDVPPDELTTRTILEDAQPSKEPGVGYDIEQLLDPGSSPQLGPPVVEQGGDVVGGNRRMLRFMKYLELIHNDPESQADLITRLKVFAAAHGMYYPQGDKLYIPVRMMEDPILTTGRATELGDLLNKSASQQIDEDAKAISHGRMLYEAQREDENAGRDGILDRISERFNSADTPRQAMTNEPKFFVDVIRKYLNIGKQEEVNWIGKNALGEEALKPEGKDKLEKALLSTVIKSPATLDLLKESTSLQSLLKGIGPMIRMRGIPEKNLTNAIEAAVQAAAQTERFNVEGNSPRDRWLKAFTVTDIFADRPPQDEPGPMVEAIWRTMFDRKTTRFKNALNDYLVGEGKQGGMFMQEIPKTPVELFNAAFEPELKDIRKARAIPETMAKGLKDEAAQKHIESLPWKLTEDQFNAGLEGQDVQSGPELRRPELAALRKSVDEMSPEEMKKAIETLRQERETDELTGLKNKKGFLLDQATDPAPFVGFGDVDGLKAFNDNFGHDAGDRLIQAMGDALRAVGVEAYRDHGDEFLYRGADGAELEKKLKAAQLILKNKEFEVRGDQGKGELQKISGLGFSFGIGKDLNEAEQRQYAEKQRRTVAGERQERGKLEPGIKPPPTLEVESKLPEGVMVFGSGANSLADMEGHYKAGMPIGISVPELSENGITKLADYAREGHPVFMDSGAFSEVSFGKDGMTVDHPITDDEWVKRLATMKRVAMNAKTEHTVTVMAPDMVGSQNVTLDRLQRFSGQVRELLTHANVMVALQNGELSPAEFFWEAKDAILGEGGHKNEQNIIPAFPMNKAAANGTEIIDFVREEKPHRIHLLGTSMDDAGTRQLVTALKAKFPKLQITMDANKIRANTDEILSHAADVRENLMQDAMGEVAREGKGSKDYTELVYKPSEWANKGQLKRIGKQLEDVVQDFDKKLFAKDPDAALEQLETNDWVDHILTDEYLKSLGKDVASEARKQAVSKVLDREKKGGIAPPPQPEKSIFATEVKPGDQIQYLPASDKEKATEGRVTAVDVDEHGAVKYTLETEDGKQHEVLATKGVITKILEDGKKLQMGMQFSRERAERAAKNRTERELKKAGLFADQVEPASAEKIFESNAEGDKEDLKRRKAEIQNARDLREQARSMVSPEDFAKLEKARKIYPDTASWDIQYWKGMLNEFGTPEGRAKSIAKMQAELATAQQKLDEAKNDLANVKPGEKIKSVGGEVDAKQLYEGRVRVHSMEVDRLTGRLALADSIDKYASQPPLPRRNAMGTDALERALSPEAQKNLAEMFKKLTAGRDLRRIREGMEIYQNLIDEGMDAEAKALRDATENYFLKPNGKTAAEFSEAAFEGLKAITGEEDPDWNQLLENEVFADAEDAGRLIFDTLDPRTASFDAEEFNTAFGNVEFRREPDEVFRTPKKRVDYIPEKAKKALPVITPEEAKARLEEWKRTAKALGEQKDEDGNPINHYKVVYSLYDESGAISKPWRDAGYTVRQFDIAHGDDLTEFGKWMAQVEDDIAEGYEVEGVLAQPPCTSFTLSGTRWWKTEHDLPSREMVAKKYGEAAAELFERPLDYANTMVAIVKLFVAQANPKWYAMENPAYGRINTQNHLPEAVLGFDPNNFGDPYTKRTQLWGEFNPDLPLANVEPTEGSRIHKLRGDNPKQKKLRSLTPDGFAYAFFMANHDLPESMRADVAHEAQVGIKPPPGSLPKPEFVPEEPKPSTAVYIPAARELAAQKAAQGYVTPDQLKAFLEVRPDTKNHVPELMRTAQMMAEYVYDADPPEGVSRKEALDWVLRERLAKIESGNLKGKRGEYSDPNLEKSLGTKIMKLHQAADETTFLHEFFHVIFPFLSTEDLKALDSIGDKRVWDGNPSTLRGEVYAKLSEKGAGGLERFLRDQNPRDFDSEVKTVLGKIKGIFRKIYLQFKRDPLAPFTLSSDAVELFDKMFHITGSDVPDVWREEVKKARLNEKKIVRPEEAVQPEVKAMRDAGAKTLGDTANGEIKDAFGDRVDPNKPILVGGFDDEVSATSAYMRFSKSDSPFSGAELIKKEDGTWAVRVNAKTGIDKSKLFQGLPASVDALKDSEKKFDVSDADNKKADDARFIFPDGRVLYSEEPHLEVAKEVIGTSNTDRYMRRTSAVRIVPVTKGDMAFEPNHPPFYFEIYGRPTDEQLRSMADLVDGQDFTYDIHRRGGMVSSDNRIPMTVGRLRVHLDQLFPEKGAGAEQARLFQELPERHPGLQLEDLEKRLAALPTYQLAQRKLLELQIKNLKNKIRSDYGVEEAKPEPAGDIPKQAVEEAKDVQKANPIRTGANGLPGRENPPRVAGIPKPPNAGRIERPATGQRPGRADRRVAEPAPPISLEGVKPVTLQPLDRPRGNPVGLTENDEFRQDKWEDRLRKGGLPENLPAPTKTLDPKTAAQLIYPGQKEIVQVALSALDQGDGVAIVTPPGSGKTYTGSAIIAEYLRDNPDADILFVTKNSDLYNNFRKVAKDTFGVDVSDEPLEKTSDKGVFSTSYMSTLNDSIYANKKWNLVVADESGEARRSYDPNTQQGAMLRKIINNADKAVYMSATPFHSPAEYSYLDKLNLWAKGRYSEWLKNNFKHRIVNGEVIAELDPPKQAKLREQLIERGQLIPQRINYEGYTAHFGVVPVTHDMERGLNRIRVGFDRARQTFEAMGKKGLARKVSAFEAVYTKNFLERSRLPQAIELIQRALDQGWKVQVFSEHTSDDLFRRERLEGEDPSTYQELDDAMGGGLSKIIPPYPGVYGELEKAFPGMVGDYSGRGNTDAARRTAKNDFLKGDKKVLYTSYAGGGIGVSLHDGDYPELDVKGGQQPTVAIYLGPPYSGVLLEQAMGRPWRFGVKSDVHAVFLATDAEPDVHLMQTKIGPRMKALRAAVVGEKDSLADVMSSYTDAEKVRERQEALAYEQGNEVKFNPTDLVAKRGRRVGIQTWDQIRFPSAEEAKNKGMKYGDKVTGGDWSTLYQDAEKLWKGPPESPEQVAGEQTIDAIANEAMKEGSPVLQNLDPAEKQSVVGAVSAIAADDVALKGDRDPEAVAKSTMKWGLKIPSTMDVRFETEKTGTWPFTKTRQKAIWTYPEGKEPTNVPVGEPSEPEGKNYHTRYIGWGVMKGGIESIARQAGVPEIGKKITRAIGMWQRDVDMIQSQFRWYARENFEKNGLDWKKQSVVAEVMAVAERQKVSDDPAINRTAEAMREWFAQAATSAVNEGVKKKDRSGKWVPFKPLEDYWTHIIDWKATVEYKDPKTGEMKQVSLRDAMKHTFPEDARNALMAKLASAAKWSDGEPVSIADLDRYLRRNYRKGTPVQPNVQTERTINFPIVRKDFDVLTSYAGQIARAISTERYFGSDRGKMLKEISKIPSANGRKDITLMFDSLLSPQELSGRWLKFSNAMTAYTALTKMTLSFIKVPFHAMHMVYALHGDVRPMVKGIADAILNNKQAREDAIFMGTLARQVDFTGLTDTGQKKGPSHLMFELTGFNAAYDLGRVWSAQSAKVWMEQYAMNGLKKGGKAAVETRRMLVDTMLIGDHAIDAAIEAGHFSEADIQRAQVAFANEVMFTDNPMEMPKWARMHVGRDTSGDTANVYRFMRLTYSMASFTVKTRALLRKYIIDETFRYGNPKMLALFAVMEPIIGASVWTAANTGKTAIQKGMEALGGYKPQPNALDREKDEFEKAIWGKNGPKKLAQDVELLLDMMTVGVAQEQVRLVGDLLLDIAADPKKALRENEYIGPDIFEGIIGPIWATTILKPYEWTKNEVRIMSNNKPHKGKQTLTNTYKTLFGEVPVTSNIPQVKKLTHPPR